MASGNSDRNDDATMEGGDDDGEAASPGNGGHSIYKLQGRNPDLSIATTGNTRKTIVSTLKEMVGEDGATLHEYYHRNDPNNKWWFKEQPLIDARGASYLNHRLGAFYNKPSNNVKTTAAPRASNNETQQHIAAAQASMNAAARSAARTDGQLGGTGETPSAQLLSATPVECAICTDEDRLVTPGSRDSITSTCGHIFHASCFAQWIVKNPNCPLCRKTLAPAPVAADDESDDSFTDERCLACNQPVSEEDRVACDVADCSKVICIDCNKTTITSAMINDTSTHFCCPDHHDHAKVGYVKLEASRSITTATNIRASTTPKARAARLHARTSGNVQVCAMGARRASTLAPAAAKGKKPGSSIAKEKKMWRAVPFKKGLPTSEQLVSKPIPKQASWMIKQKWRQESGKRVEICKRNLLKLRKKNIIDLAVEFESPRVVSSGGPNPKRLLITGLPLPEFYDLLAGELAEKITDAASKVA